MICDVIWSTHTHTLAHSHTHTLMLVVFYSYLGCVLEAASALLREDHHCLSLIMVDAPGVSLINRQSLLINNWTAPLVFFSPLAASHSQGFFRSRLPFPALYLHGDTLLSELLHSLRNELYEDTPRAKSEEHTPPFREIGGVVQSVHAVSAH